MPSCAVARLSDVQPWPTPYRCNRKTGADPIGSFAATRELRQPKGVDAGGSQEGCRCHFSHWSGSMDLQVPQRDSMAATTAAPTRPNDDGVIETSIPARLDSLRWS